MVTSERSVIDQTIDKIIGWLKEHAECPAVREFLQAEDGDHRQIFWDWDEADYAKVELMGTTKNKLKFSFSFLIKADSNGISIRLNENGYLLLIDAGPNMPQAAQFLLDLNFSDTCREIGDQLSGLLRL